jgi:hypothetical protein
VSIGRRGPVELSVDRPQGLVDLGLGRCVPTVPVSTVNGSHFRKRPRLPGVYGLSPGIDPKGQLMATVEFCHPTRSAARRLRPR